MDSIVVDEVNLSELFSNTKSIEELLINLEVARANSVGVKVIERETKIENISIDILREKISKVVIVGVRLIVPLNVKENLNNHLKI